MDSGSYPTHLRSMPDATDRLEEIARVIIHNQQVIYGQLQSITGKVNNQMTDLSNLQAAVTQETTVTQSFLTFVQGIVDELQAAKDDPAKVQALADQINANTAALQTALTANTPVSGAQDGTPDNPPADTPAPADNPTPPADNTVSDQPVPATTGTVADGGDQPTTADGGTNTADVPPVATSDGSTTGDASTTA